MARLAPVWEDLSRLYDLYSAVMFLEGPTIPSLKGGGRGYRCLGYQPWCHPPSCATLSQDYSSSGHLSAEGRGHQACIDTGDCCSSCSSWRPQLHLLRPSLGSCFLAYMPYLLSCSISYHSLFKECSKGVGCGALG